MGISSNCNYGAVSYLVIQVGTRMAKVTYKLPGAVSEQYLISTLQVRLNPTGICLVLQIDPQSVISYDTCRAQIVKQ